MGAVQQLCEKGILLEHGAVKYSGNVCQVIDRYNYQMINNEIVILNKSKMIESYKINIEGSLADEKSKVGINLNVLQKLENIFFDVALHNEKGERLVHIRNDKKYFFDLNKGTHWLYYEFEKMPIRAGDVFASFYLADKNKNETYLHLKNCHIAHFECEDDVYPTKPILYPDYSLHINETKKFEKYYGAKG
jgi:ABC-type glutathione transport system ATPase component